MNQAFDVIVRFDNRDEMFCEPITRMTMVYAMNWDAAIQRAWTLTYASVRDTPMEVWDPRLQKWLPRT